jgi:hypothetical protein
MSVNVRNENAYRDVEQRRSKWYEAFRPTSTFQVLDGTWETTWIYRERDEIWDAPEEYTFQEFIPEILKGGLRDRCMPESEQVGVSWYRRSFVISGDIARAIERGNCIFLHFGGVAWRWSAWLNDRPLVDKSYDALNAHDIDVTGYLKPNESNVITIACTDSHGLARDMRYGKVFNPRLFNPRMGDFVAPAPEAPCDPRVWGEIELWARPTSRIDDVFVRPDFRNGQLHLDLETTVTRDVSTEVKIRNQDGGYESVPFPETALSPECSTRTISADWMSPRLWSTEDPYLYFVEVQLRCTETGEVLDRREFRFGFREVWIDGGNVMMNGRRLFMAKDSAITTSEHELRAHAPLDDSSTVRDQLANIVKEGRAHNSINTLRIHRSAFYRPGAFASFADELGILICPETAYCMGDRFALDLPEFWERCLDYLKGWTKAGRNHPSIVNWSLTNEFLWCGAWKTNRDSFERLYEQEQLVKELDPTRIVSWDGDWDLPDQFQVGMGKSETANIHYPLEMSMHWWPTETWGFERASMEKPIPIRGHYGKFIWEHDSKPIFCGEYAWNQKNYFEGGPTMCKYIGDKAYDWDYWCSGESQVTVVKWQTDAFRVARFAGLNPWLYWQGHYRLMPRETVILRRVPTVYYSGKEMGLEAYLLNDTLRDCTYRVSWEITARERSLGAGIRGFEIPGGEMETFKLNLAVKEVSAPVEGELVIRVERDGVVVNTESYPVRLRPNVELSWPSGALLLDPTGETAEFLRRLGMSPERTRDTEAVSKASAVVLGFETLAILEAHARKTLAAFVRDGGTVLTLGESSWPEEGFGTNTVFAEAPANHAWVRSPGHPLLDGITDQDLGFWGAEEWVNHHVFIKPVKNQGTVWRTLVDVGAREGLHGAALVEIFEGRGRYILNQLNLHHAEDIPGAKAVLGALLRQLTVPVVERVAVSQMLDDDDPVLKQLGNMRIRRSKWNEMAVDIPLIVDAGCPEANPEQISEWVTRGGVAWLMGLTTENVDRWSATIAGLSLSACDSYDGALIANRNPLLWGISNEELFWCDGVWIRNTGGAEHPRGNAMSQLASIAYYSVACDRASALTDPAVLAKVPQGRGMWLLSTINFASGLARVRAKATRLVQGLFTNLGLGAEANTLEDIGDYRMLDISAVANRGFQDDVAGTGSGGWTDEGFFRDLHFFPQNISGFDWANLPMPAPDPSSWSSSMMIDGVRFSILDPRLKNGRTCIVMAPDFRALPDVKKGDLIAEPISVPVGDTCDFLYSMHASARVEAAEDGELMWTYRLHFDDGETAEFPVRLGSETGDWAAPRGLPRAEVAWMGIALEVKPIVLYMATFRNPRHDRPVRTLEIVPARTRGLSGIVAISTGKLASH